MPAYSFPANSGFPSFQMLWCVCMPVPLSPKIGLGMKVDGLAMPARDVLDDVLVHHHFVGRLHQRVEPDIDFRLAGRGHFVVMLLSRIPAFSISRIISLRISCCVSVGGTGK